MRIEKSKKKEEKKGRKSGEKQREKQGFSTLSIKVMTLICYLSLLCDYEKIFTVETWRNYEELRKLSPRCLQLQSLISKGKCYKKIILDQCPRIISPMKICLWSWFGKSDPLTGVNFLG